MDYNASHFRRLQRERVPSPPHDELVDRLACLDLHLRLMRQAPYSPATLQHNTALALQELIRLVAGFEGVELPSVAGVAEAPAASAADPGAWYTVRVDYLLGATRGEPHSSIRPVRATSGPAAIGIAAIWLFAARPDAAITGVSAIKDQPSPGDANG